MWYGARARWKQTAQRGERAVIARGVGTTRVVAAAGERLAHSAKHAASRTHRRQTT